MGTDTSWIFGGLLAVPGLPLSTSTCFLHRGAAAFASWLWSLSPPTPCGWDTRAVSGLWLRAAGILELYIRKTSVSQSECRVASKIHQAGSHKRFEASGTSNII